MSSNKDRIDEIYNTYGIAASDLVSARFSEGTSEERKRLALREQDAYRNWLMAISDGLEENDETIEGLLSEVKKANKELAGLISQEKKPRYILKTLTSAIKAGTKLIGAASS